MRPCGQLFFVTVFVIGVFWVSSSCSNEAKREFDVVSGPAEQTFLDFAEQANVGIVFDSEGIDQEVTNPVKGWLSIDAAITAMVEDTGLTYAYDTQTDVISIQKVDQ
ncbi:MAG: hypothetical protein MI748_07315 [Opitutales bacterium]|nr:hypothetical protein [Opitutales bacterium]